MLDLARETVAMDTMAQRFGKKFYQNGARLSGVLEVDTDAKPETRRRLKDEFRGYAADDAFAVAVLAHGMKFTPLGRAGSSRRRRSPGLPASPSTGSRRARRATTPTPSSGRTT